jgi:hypothetical protein
LPPDSLDDTARIWRRNAFSEWFYPELIQLDEHRGHRRIGVSEENAPADANKLPPKSSKNGFSINIVLKLLRSVPFFAVALDCQPSGVPFDDEVYPIRPYWPLRFHSITSREQPLKHQLFEDRIGPFALYFHRAQQRLRVACMLDEPAPKVAWFGCALGSSECTTHS